MHKNLQFNRNIYMMFLFLKIWHAAEYLNQKVDINYFFGFNESKPTFVQ